MSVAYELEVNLAWPYPQKIKCAFQNFDLCTTSSYKRQVGWTPTPSACVSIGNSFVFFHLIVCLGYI